jgi:hypothetical protein
MQVMQQIRLHDDVLPVQPPPALHGEMATYWPMLGFATFCRGQVTLSTQLI